jgi:alpha-glucosidase
MHFHNAIFWLSALVAISTQGVLCGSVDGCPGYKASNVQRSTGKLTADLTLAGDACNVYGYDLKDLRLLVEYQSRKPK